MFSRSCRCTASMQLVYCQYRKPSQFCLYTTMNLFLKSIPIVVLAVLIYIVWAPRNGKEENKVNFEKKNPRNVLILNDEWSTKKGGVSSFHRQIAYLAKQPGVNVYVTALTATPEDKQDAQNKGIHLIVADDKGQVPSKMWLGLYRSIHFPTLCTIDLHIIIGHIPITGEEAIDLKEICFPDAKLFLFVHVIPIDTLMHKKWTPELLEENETKILTQAKKSDMVFSVGPRIFNHYDSNFVSAHVSHKQFLPHPDKEFYDINIRRPEKHHNRKVLTAGRVKGVGNLKGYDIVAAALSKVADIHRQMHKNPPTWVIRGFPDDDNTKETWKSVIREVTSANLKVYPLPYGTQEQIQNDLEQSHLFIMPSRSEPFGLVGLEAMAAGLPVLVTANSGMALFIEEHFPDIAGQLIVNVGVTDRKLEDDIKEWEKKITYALNNYNVVYDGAQKLQERLKNSASIYNSQKDFCKLILD
ncbi:uncharacterized protein LOC144352159 [Saccoglossus kowalevskii]